MSKIVDRKFQRLPSFKCANSERYVILVLFNRSEYQRFYYEECIAIRRHYEGETEKSGIEVELRSKDDSIAVFLSASNAKRKWSALGESLCRKMNLLFCRRTVLFEPILGSRRGRGSIRLSFWFQNGIECSKMGVSGEVMRYDEDERLLEFNEFIGVFTGFLMFFKRFEFLPSQTRLSQ